MTTPFNTPINVDEFHPFDQHPSQFPSGGLESNPTDGTLLDVRPIPPLPSPTSRLLRFYPNPYFPCFPHPSFLHIATTMKLPVPSQISQSLLSPIPFPPDISSYIPSLWIRVIPLYEISLFRNVAIKKPMHLIIYLQRRMN